MPPIRSRRPWFASWRRGERTRRKSMTAPEAAIFSIYALEVRANDGTVNTSPGAGVATVVPAPAAGANPAVVWIAGGLGSLPLHPRIPPAHLTTPPNTPLPPGFGPLSHLP